MPVTLDLRNAFNSARWADMLGTLQRNLRVPQLLVIMQDYLRDRKLSYETVERKKSRMVTAGVVQGSILGPDFWNESYDGFLHLDMPLWCSW